MFRSCLILFSLRPSTLRVRVPRVGLCDDSTNVNKALKSIRKQLGPPRKLDSGRYKDSPKDTPENSSMYTVDSVGDSLGNSVGDNLGDTDVHASRDISRHSDGYCQLLRINDDSNSICTNTYISNNPSNIPNTPFTDHGDNTRDTALRFEINSRNRYHKNLWTAMKKRDSLSFNRTCQQLRNSGLELDAVSYTLMINGTLMFSKSSDMDQALGMVEEMKEAGIHPCFIRFLSVYT